MSGKLPQVRVVGVTFREPRKTSFLCCTVCIYVLTYPDEKVVYIYSAFIYDRHIHKVYPGVNRYWKVLIGLPRSVMKHLNRLQNN